MPRRSSARIFVACCGGRRVTEEDDRNHYDASVTGGAAPIRLSYVAITAQTAPCGAWPKIWRGIRWKTATTTISAVATQSNLAAQIANPTDLVGPRQMSPIDAEQRGQVIDSWRGTKRATAEPRSSSTETGLRRKAMNAIEYTIESGAAGDWPADGSAPATSNSSGPCRASRSTPLRKRSGCSDSWSVAAGPPYGEGPASHHRWRHRRRRDHFYQRLDAQSDHSRNRGRDRLLLSELAPLAEVCDPSTKVIVIGRHNDIALYSRADPQRHFRIYGRAGRDGGYAERRLGDLRGSGGGAARTSLAFIGAKGGCGSSVIAIIAPGACQSFLDRDDLADLDLPYGTANIDLIRTPAGDRRGRIRTDRLDEVFSRPAPDRCSDHLSLLAAPLCSTAPMTSRTGAFQPILEVLPAQRARIRSDLPHGWTDWTPLVLSAPTRWSCTAAPDLASLRNAKNLLDALKKLSERQGTASRAQPGGRAQASGDRSR